MAPKILTFAYSLVGYHCLKTLLDNKENVVGVITHENNPHENIWFPSVEKLALAHKIPVFKPSSVNTPEMIDTIRTLKPDIIFAFYYRDMITQAILDIPPLGAFNMHGSLLPKYRGRVPINWAIIHGEKQTGATLHWMVKAPDAGDIVDQQAIPIDPNHNALIVTEAVAQNAVLVLQRSLSSIKSGAAKRIPQDPTQATYFGGRSAKDGVIDWSQTPWQIHNLIRALSPYPMLPGAWTTVNKAAVRILKDCHVPANSSTLPVAPNHKLPTTAAPGEILAIYGEQPILRVACGPNEKRDFLDIYDLRWMDNTNLQDSTENPKDVIKHLSVGQVLGK